ncbi:TIGR01777 family oxidoreductase [Desulfonatronum thioautotrophicum]|uniref:TIGR01777 family oxidoreductase n=1 Tax=Desulfonatronum thioautotrophicum TaxID=617001 RepID=UPI0005EACEAD|nr:TIGR01777 family oxidoreductase [Desulfonatronum thioautotrophicum]
MHFFILGGTGFVGRHLINWLLQQGHKVEALGRNPKSLDRLPAGCEGVHGDPLQPGDWQTMAGQADVVINLVGRSIMTRWNDATRKEILETRVQSTRMAVQALSGEHGRGKVLINANAVGYYPLDSTREFAEDGPAGTGFLADVAQAWQAEAEKARAFGVRVVIARFGTVLGPDGGAMAQLLPLFRKGLGGRLGSGEQWFPWIHVLDLCRAMEFMAQHPELDGPVNCCAPQPASNTYFTRALGGLLRRPTIFPVPAFVLKLAMGEVAQVVLQGAKIVPKALIDAGFAFRFGLLEGALRDIIRQVEAQ